ncbi:Flp family type IVb pilin [Asticcacaulis benevestitus]|uniref:Fimbrial protein n=1 Tax=Asticcacaulis benevestitus DSM 16100 = ATCC BAA-896 TaxID=1121022 RepID=V4PIE8_9CAUL|nr:Flp family type IVb pilin [Asticcacaulis benevestitus]ESQ93717.1 fimbrial protein [Asticcacaulis benevestitus DSM 16100 = ATCC BAA-896]
MTKFFNQFASDESGATAIEYGLIAALIAVALISILGTVSTSLTGTFNRVATDLDAANLKK